MVRTSALDNKHLWPVGGNIDVGWLDVLCASCKTRHRLGVKNSWGKTVLCKACGEEIEFQRIWDMEAKREEDDELLRWFWSQQL